MFFVACCVVGEDVVTLFKDYCFSICKKWSTKKAGIFRHPCFFAGLKEDGATLEAKCFLFRQSK